jgi:hypothetical protein
VIFDPLAVDGNIAFDEMKALMSEASIELVVIHVHAIDLPVLLLKDGLGEAITYESVDA